MAMFLHFNFESALDISVPRAAEGKDATALSQEIIVNIDRDGAVSVGQKKLELNELVALLRRASELSARQPVVIRADQKTFHERVVSVLDAAARAGIWNISFATTRE
jgi:biopolymer transport protein ExbD